MQREQYPSTTGLTVRSGMDWKTVSACAAPVLNAAIVKAAATPKSFVFIGSLNVIRKGDGLPPDHDAPYLPYHNGKSRPSPLSSTAEQMADIVTDIILGVHRLQSFILEKSSRFSILRVPS